MKSTSLGFFSLLLVFAAPILAASPVFVSIAPAGVTVTNASDVTLVGEVTGAASLVVDGQAVTLVGDTFSAGPYALVEGSNTFTLVADDGTGETAQVVHTIVRDTAPPQLSVSQPASGALVGSGSVLVAGTASDAHLSSVTVGGTEAQRSGTSFQALGVPLAEGSNSLVVRAEDAAGNFTEMTRTVVRDTTAPTVAITDPAPGTITPLERVTLSGTAADPQLDRVEVGGVRAALSGGAWSIEVTLAEGSNTFTATAYDRLGHSSSESVTLSRDSQAPDVHVDLPAEGLSTHAAEVAVSGTVSDEPGVSVTVNGLEATVTAGSFNVTVPLEIGETRLVARATDALGNQGVHTRTIERDVTAPSFLGADPASGALEVPIEAIFRLSFDEELAPPPAGSWSLETAAGTPLAATATLVGSPLVDGVLEIRPDALLPPETEIRLILTTTLSDPADNPLANPQTLSFTTADVGAPSAPSLTAIPSPLCAASAIVSGTAEAEARVRVSGGGAGGSVRAAADGSFSLSAALVPGALNRLVVVAEDAAGNLSPEAVAEVIHDCEPPRVVSAQVENGAVVVGFSEALDAATLPGQVLLSDDAGALAGTSALSSSSEITFTPSSALPTGVLRLEVETGLTDLAGNALAFPHSEILQGAVASSFFTGTVLDATTGRPLAGARVVVSATDGAAPPAPAPEMTTGSDGRFQLAVPAGVHDVTLGHPSAAPAFRVVTTQAGQGTEIFDARLEPLAEGVSVDTSGGTVEGSGGASLLVPAGALAAAAEISVTALDEQSLPVLLPYGWSPRGAAWLETDAALGTGTTLTLAADAAEGTPLVAVALDLATLEWYAVADVVVAGMAGEDNVASFEITGLGAYAVVEADGGALAPPAAVVGQALGSAAVPVGDEITGAQISFAPPVVLPEQASRATVDYTLASPVASGVPLTLQVREDLELLSGETVSEEPYEADLVLYYDSAGQARSEFWLAPSERARREPISMGTEDVKVLPYAGGDVRGDVVGSSGGTATNDEGDVLELPAGALVEPSAVILYRRPASELPLSAPVGGAVEGVIDVDLGGLVLDEAGRLTLELGTAPDATHGGLLLQVIELEGA